MTPLLSIGIPTRNRPQALQKTLDTIERQIEAAGVSNKVEIVVSDNTDVDDLRLPASVVNRMSIRYLSNEGNIGYARNVNKLITEACGQYVWLLADDDMVQEGAVQCIVACLEWQKDPINYLTFYSGAVWGGETDDNFYFKNCTQHYFANGKDFLQKYWRNVIFISVNVFHRGNIVSHAKEHGLFENRNDVYQNSLMGLSLIDRLGHVQVIPKTLVFDSYDKKLYSPFNSVSVPVLEYVKLLTQLRALGVHRACLREIKKDVDASILSNGLRFVIRKMETTDEFDYAAEYRKVIGNKELYASSRAKAVFVYALFKLNPMVVKPLVKFLYAMKGKTNLYEALRKDSIYWYQEMQKKSIKVSYG